VGLSENSGTSPEKFMVDHDSPYENKALKHGHLIDIPSTEVSEEFGPTGGA